MPDADSPKPEQDKKTGRFVSGNIGGGRPKGSRNKLGEAFLTDMLNDWEQHGPTAIATVRDEKPDAYLKVIASILPRDLNVNINPADEMTDDQVLERLRELDAAIGPFLAAAGANGADGSAEETTRH